MLDPACGTGNFLYVSMELMKRLEGEVLESRFRTSHIDNDMDVTILSAGRTAIRRQ